MSKLFFINFKSNLKVSETQKYLDKLNNLFVSPTNKFIICLNHLCLFLTNNNYKFEFGVQSFFKEQLGAFTSCNTLQQILEFKNVKYCLLGHCEELKYFNLDLIDINQKIKSIIKETNIKPLICFGDEINLEFNQKINLLIEQLDKLLKGINNFENIILAYEPKYMVNNNLEINVEEINKLFKILKCKLKQKYKHNFTICYGGNVNETNIINFNNQNNIDGFLIGRYGLKIENIEFIFKNILAK